MGLKFSDQGCKLIIFVLIDLINGLIIFNLQLGIFVIIIIIFYFKLGIKKYFIKIINVLLFIDILSVINIIIFMRIII